MTVCTRCDTATDMTYSCVHTGDREMCRECYQEIHWLLTNNLYENEGRTGQ